MSASVLSTALAPLMAIPSWVVWRNGKAPRQARDPNRFASTSDRATWAPYDVARQAVLDGSADGVGFVLTHTRITAFDLDNCVSWSSDGEIVIVPQAQELVERCSSYTELTLSHRGLRIIGWGNGAPEHSKFTVDDWSLEIYRRAVRYITVTGSALPGYDRPLCNIDAVVDTVRRPAPVPAPVVNANKSHGAAPPAPCDFDEDDLDCALLHFAQNGVEQGQRSCFFQLIVNELFKKGWPLEQVYALFERYPDGLAAKYRGRLQQEVARSYAKAEARYGRN